MIKNSYCCFYINESTNLCQISDISYISEVSESYSGAAKLTYRAFYDKSMKFGTVIPLNIPISFGRGGNLGHA